MSCLGTVQALWPKHNIRPDPNNLINFHLILHFEKCLLSVDGNNIFLFEVPIVGSIFELAIIG